MHTCITLGHRKVSCMIIEVSLFQGVLISMFHYIIDKFIHWEVFHNINYIALHAAILCPRLHYEQFNLQYQFFESLPSLSIPFSVADQRVSEVQSNTRALKCLIDAMQDNTGRVTAGLKGELTRLGRLVDNLSRNYERLDREVHQLRQQQSQGSGEALLLSKLIMFC